MSYDLGWRADGIARAEACGGVPLEVYHRPGFTGGRAVRRADFAGGGGSGIVLDPAAPDPDEDEDGARP